ncbi:FAD-dependent oxidoreductase [Gammaproteobacteria bacterium]|nr:FAD-dependent oxidoreductase [Gammaproteobacteria bacterium]
MAGVIIIGAGQAAAQTAASLRQEKFEGPITIFGEESELPYQRPPLSKDFLAGKIGVEKTLARPVEFYSSKNIAVNLNTKVLQIDPERKVVSTASSEKYTYDDLVIATGSRARELRIPGIELDGIHYLRSLKDVNSIKNQMKTAKKLCIVGGGYIGLEVAAVARDVGIEVTILEMESRILKRVTTEAMSQFYHALHSRRGVEIVCNAQVKSFEGAGSVSSVITEQKSFKSDLVIVGIGVLPNSELAEGSGIECENGILVNENCKTSVKNIYAIGDCTNHPNPILKRRLRLESVPNAMEQARVAANNIVGGNKKYSTIPWFWSDQYDLKLQMLGFSSDGESSVTRGEVSEEKFAVFYLTDQKIVAVDAVNSPKEFMLAKQLYGEKADPEQLSDVNFDLKKMLN